MVLGLMFKFNQFLVIFCVWFKIAGHFLSFVCGCPVYLTLLTEEIAFPHCIFLGLLS